MFYSNFESDSTSFTSSNVYSRDEVSSMLYLVNKDEFICAVLLGIPKEAIDAENAQNQQLKHFLAAALYPFSPLYLGRHNLESIKVPVIAPSSESKLGRLYDTGSRLE